MKITLIKMEFTTQILNTDISLEIISYNNYISITFKNEICFIQIFTSFIDSNKHLSKYSFSIILDNFISLKNE